MNLDRTRAYPELISDHLVLLTRDEQAQDCLLALGEPRKARLGLRCLGTRLVLLPTNFEGALDRSKDHLLGKRFLDKIDWPAFIARTASGTSPCPVMTMTGSAMPSACSRSCTANPPMPGIRTSIIKQPSSDGGIAARNSPPEPKDRTR